MLRDRNPHGIIAEILEQYSVDFDGGRAKRRLAAYERNFMRIDKRRVAKIFKVARGII
jgi:hypothetical protein